MAITNTVVLARGNLVLGVHAGNPCLIDILPEIRVDTSNNPLTTSDDLKNVL